MAFSERLLLWAVSGAAAAVGMEYWSRLLHRRFWHGPFWRLHKSHHSPTGPWEANDLLPLSHAPLAMGLILYGCLGTPGPLRELAFGTGVGMTVFGVAYVAVHDGAVHGRFPVGPLARIPGVARIRRAHGAHHSSGGAPFGMFLGPRELRGLQKKRQEARAKAAPRPL